MEFRSLTLFNLEGARAFEERRGYSSAGRAPALQAGGQRFDPVYLHQMGPELSWLERTTDNREVGGSSPLGPTTFLFLKSDKSFQE